MFSQITGQGKSGIKDKFSAAKAHDMSPATKQNQTHTGGFYQKLQPGFNFNTG